MARLRGGLRVAESPFPFLVTSESGYGREVVARGVHQTERRPDHRFENVNSAALVAELAEAELSRYVRSASPGRRLPCGLIRGRPSSSSVRTPRPLVPKSTPCR